MHGQKGEAANQEPSQDKHSQEQVLLEELLRPYSRAALCTRHLANLSACQRTYWFHKLGSTQSWLLFFFFPKSKEQGATREFSSWMGGRAAWVSGKCRCWRKQHCAFNIFPGISCSLQCVGCIQSPVYSKILRSGFACMCLQPVTGRVWYFFLLESFRLGEGSGFVWFSPS